MNAVRVERRELIKDLRSSSLTFRSAQASKALEEAARLVDELQKELSARAAILAEIKAEAEAANREADDARKLADLNAETVSAVNAYWDRMLEDKLGAFERSARQREWTVGTVVALVVGIVAILLAHYLFHF